MPKYKGPERRWKSKFSRRFLDRDRTLGRRTSNMGLGREAFGPPPTTTSRRHSLDVFDVQRGDTGGSGIGQYERGIVEIKETIIPTERRVGGAGRRKGDLARAIKVGEPVVFDMSKTPKSVFKTGRGVLKKIAKKAGPLGIALGVFGAAKEAKAMGSTIGSSTAYKGSKNILPPKPRIK